MTKKSKPYFRMLLFGVLSIGSYLLLFSKIQIVMDYFTRGGKYAALIIITALFFSFVHGAFASATLDVLGLTPKNK